MGEFRRNIPDWNNSSFSKLGVNDIFQSGIYVISKVEYGECGIFQIGIICLFRNLVLTTYSKVEYPVISKVEYGVGVGVGMGMGEGEGEGVGVVLGVGVGVGVGVDVGVGAGVVVGAGVGAGVGMGVGVYFIA